MGVALVGDVPDYFVLGGIEDVVEGHRHFYDAEGGAEVAAGLGDGADDVPAELVGELREEQRAKRAEERSDELEYCASIEGAKRPT